jgi:hypothetical protein
MNSFVVLNCAYDGTNYYAGVHYYQITPPWPNLIPFPEFPASNAVATHSQGPYPVAPTVVSEALIGA